MPDKLRLSLFTALPLCRAEGLAALLDGLEADPEFRPTNWGENERAAQPYKRSALLKEVGGYKPGLRMPGVARRKEPRYAGYFNADATGAQAVHLEFAGAPGAEALGGIFRFGSRLAEHLRPLFGFAHPVWLGKGQEYNVAGRLDAKEFRKFGPRSICARTWLGPWLVEEIGRDRLDSAGAVVTDAVWGGVETDLLPDPWTREIGPLAKARTRVMAALADAGVFGDYSVSMKYKPGQRWAGVPAPVE
jgi:hypothetical protein